MSQHAPRQPHRESLTLDDFRYAPGDRRQDGRLACDQQLLVLTCVGDELEWSFLRVDVVDCSPGGLGLRTGTPMKPGDQFLAKLKLDTARMLVYTVRHCAAAGGNRFKVGAELTDVIGAPGDGDGSAVRNALLRASADRPAPPRRRGSSAN
jgi:hypothetical protein